MSASSAEGLLALCGCFMGFSTIAVSLRFYSRKHQNLSLGLDDWTALFGVVTYIGACAMAIEFVVIKAYGYGTQTLSPVEYASMAKRRTIYALTYDYLFMNTLTCAKLSALFMYRRLFGTPQRNRFNTVIWITVGVLIAWCITFDVLSCFQCRSHFSAFWDGDFLKYCTLNLAWAQGLAISDCLLDLWVFLLPIPTIWSLRMSTAKRLSLIGVFLLASVGIGASIARIVIFFQEKVPAGPVVYITILEAGMIITVINLPSIWYICTSTIPSKLARSLTRSRSSKESQITRPSSGGSSNASRLDSKAALAGVQAFDPWEVQTPPPVHDSRRHSDYTDFESYTTRGTTKINAKRQFSNELPANVILVENEVEVKGDQS